MAFMNNQRNALLLRIDSAKLPEKGVSLKKTTHLEFYLNNRKVKTFEEPMDPFYKNEFLTPVMKDVFESREGTESEPKWVNTYENNYTNGDIWLPLDEKENTLKIHVINNKFTGIATITLSDEKPEIESYDLYDKTGNKIEGTFIKFGYMYGTQYEVKFYTGNRHFSPGSGVDTQILETTLPHGTDVIFPGLYKILKYINPLKAGTRDVERDDENRVVFQINGSGSASNFFICNSGSYEVIKSDSTKHPSSVSTYKIFVQEKIGIPLSLSVRLVTATGKITKWFLEKVILRFDDEQTSEIVMPCFQWITGGKLKTIAIPKGFLPMDMIENSKGIMNTLKVERENEIAMARSKYQWSKKDGMPSFLRGTEFGAYDLVPLDDQFDDYKSKDFAYLLTKGAQNALKNTKFLTCQIHHVEDYHKLYNLFSFEPIHEPESGKHWTSDEYFGWTFLAGTNPLNFSRCEKVPEQFLINEVKEFMNGSEPQDECDKGRVFIADYSDLAKYNLHTDGTTSVSSIQPGKKYSYPCICLLYVGDDFKLKPVAIQLTKEGPIFTPRDNNWQWMYAKMAVRNADSQYHQVRNHLLETHLIIETFLIALNRTVSRSHPVYRLLLPYLKYTIAINVLNRRGLSNPGGFVEKVFSLGNKLSEFLMDGYKEWDFSKSDLPSRLTAQGFSRDNKGALIDFPYMDDGLLVWDAMYEYVGNYLQLYYETDECVAKDIELKDFIKEIKTHGHAGKMFTEFSTLLDLQRFLTTLIWTTSCQHSVLNFNQYNMYGFIPNYPLALFKPPPTNKDEIDEKFIIEALPGKLLSSIQITLTNLLASLAENEEYLTSERYIELMGEPKAVECLNNFQTKLREIDETIKKRNEERISRGLTASTVLMPSKVPNSTAI